MSLSAAYPEITEIVRQMGEAGVRLAEINANEGASGNISVYLGWDLTIPTQFNQVETINLPIAVPELVGKAFIVTGSGRRLREILADPFANLGMVVVDSGGETAQQYTAPQRQFARLTSEFNSHLAVHRDQVAQTGTNFCALIHAQPPHLTYLTHINEYRTEVQLNRRLYRWQPETVIYLPEGIGVLPFCIPGSPELMQANVNSLRTHQIVVWSQHGVMARSHESVMAVVDRIEYAEAAARYETLNLANGELADGLSEDQIAAIRQAFTVQTGNSK